MSIKTVFALLALTSASSAIAEGANTVIGSFLVHTEKDPFSDANTVVALAAGNDGVIALRCMQEHLSIGLAAESSKFTEGDHFAIKIRADSKTVFDTTGTALGDKIIQVTGDDTENILNEVSGAKTVAVRIEGQTSLTFTIPLRQSAQAVAAVRKACPTKP